MENVYTIYKNPRYKIIQKNNNKGNRRKSHTKKSPHYVISEGISV